MYHIKDVEYLASVFIGTPVGQRARVVFDSGSNWLTVKGCITSKFCHVGPRRVLDPKTNKFVKDPKSKGAKKDLVLNKTDVAYYLNKTKTGYMTNGR